MKRPDNAVSTNIIDFIDHCDGYTNRRGFWFLKEVYESNPTSIKKALIKCLRTLRRINREGVDRETEFILIDRVYELNYRILARYLKGRARKSLLSDLQRINYFVQGIICGDVDNLDKHYELNEGQ